MEKHHARKEKIDLILVLEEIQISCVHVDSRRQHVSQAKIYITARFYCEHQHKNFAGVGVMLGTFAYAPHNEVKDKHRYQQEQARLALGCLNDIIVNVDYQSPGATNKHCKPKKRVELFGEGLIHK